MPTAKEAARVEAKRMLLVSSGVVGGFQELQEEASDGKGEKNDNWNERWRDDLYTS